MTRLPPPDKKLTGFYAQRPEEMLTHCAAVTLMAASLMVKAKNGRALRTLCRDEALTRRAAGKVMRTMLRQLVSPGPPVAQDLIRLAEELVALAREV